jgi:hypothetical protein
MRLNLHLDSQNLVPAIYNKTIGAFTPHILGHENVPYARIQFF